MRFQFEIVGDRLLKIELIKDGERNDNNEFKCSKRKSCIGDILWNIKCNCHCNICEEYPNKPNHPLMRYDIINSKPE